MRPHDAFLYWLLRFATPIMLAVLVALFFLASIRVFGATPPPLPPVPVRPATNHVSAAVQQGAGAAALLAGIKAKPAIAPVTTYRTNIIVWKYPPQWNPSNFWWNVLTATNIHGPWTVAVSNATGSVIVTNNHEPLRMWRLQGRVTQ